MTWGPKVTIAAASLVLGFLIGVGVVLAPRALDAVAGFSAHTDPGVVTGTCHGRPYTAVISVIPETDLVQAEVSAADDGTASWRVRWGGYQVATTKLVRDPVMNRAFGVADLGDMDNGGERELALKPVDATTWCHVHLALQ